METISKEEVLTREQELLEAMKYHDLEKLDELLHDQLVFHIPNGNIISKDMDLEAHRSGMMVIDFIATSDYVINLIGDTAMVSLMMETKGKMLDQPIEDKFRYLRVWKSFNNKLKVIGGSCIQL